MNVLLSWVLTLIIVISGIGIVMLSTEPILNQAQSAADLNLAEQTMSQLNAAVTSVAREGIGSSRILSIPTTKGMWQIVPADNMIEYRLPVSPLETGIRRIRDGLTYISGFDANCSIGTYGGNQAWIMENGYLRTYLQRVNGTIDTAKNILVMESKATGTRIILADTSIQIDGDPASSSGSGWSYMRTGSQMPKCQTNFFVNSTVSYNVFYTMYSGADFLVVEVRNIQ